MKGDVEVINQHRPESIKFNRLHASSHLNQVDIIIYVDVVIVVTIRSIIVILKSESRTIECSQSMPFISDGIH